MAERLRVAMIGAGYFAQFHGDAWHRIEDVQLCAVAAQSGARSFAQRYDIQAFTDVEEMLETGSYDLLDIATPPDSHLELVSLAARRGINAICQKPLASSLEEAINIAQVAESAGILLVIHENFRFQPWYREIKRLMRQNRFGNILNITFRLRPGDGQGAGAYLERQPYFRQMKRFLIHETAIHFVDSFRYLMGEISGVQARLRRINDAIVGEDSGLVIFEFESGAIGLFDGNRHLDHVAENTRLTMGEMWLEGDRASLRLDGFGRLHIKNHGGVETEHKYEHSNRAFGGDCVFAFQKHVVDHLLKGAPIENTVSDYLRNLHIEETIYQSHDEGRFMAV